MIQSEEQQQQPQQRTRKPQTCRICKCVGHQMRTCNDATILSQRNHVFEQIENHTPLETILDYAHNQEFERMKIITYKTPKGKTSNIAPLSANETTYYTNLERFIENEYAKQTNLLTAKIQRKIFFTRRLLPRTHDEIFNQYTQFLTEFYNTQFQSGTIENVDIEIMQFLHLCDTQSLEPTNYTPFPTYAALTRWNQFLQITQSRYMAQMQARNRAPQAVAQTYNYIKRRIAAPAEETPEKPPEESIDCPICMETVTIPNISETNCGHKYCTTCIRNTIKKYNAYKRCPCPMCREPVHTIVRKFTETPTEERTFPEHSTHPIVA